LFKGGEKVEGDVLLSFERVKLRRKRTSPSSAIDDVD
jgi:hypothetical protein